MSYFKCPKCKKIIKRDGRTKLVKGRKSLISYCEETGKDVRCKKIDNNLCNTRSLFLSKYAICGRSKNEII